jgi:hypothetical protein
MLCRPRRLLSRTAQSETKGQPPIPFGIGGLPRADLTLHPVPGRAQLCPVVPGQGKIGRNGRGKQQRGPQRQSATAGPQGKWREATAGQVTTEPATENRQGKQRRKWQRRIDSNPRRTEGITALGQETTEAEPFEHRRRWKARRNRRPGQDEAVGAPTAGAMGFRTNRVPARRFAAAGRDWAAIGRTKSGPRSGGRCEV